MTKAEKYPVLWAEFQKLQAEREAILATHEPLRADQEALRRQQDALREQEQSLVDKIKRDRPRLTDIDNQLAGLARAMGGEALNS